VRHVAQPEGHGDDVEGVLGEWQLLGVAQGGGQHHAGIDQAITAGGQHGLVDVGVHHGAARAHALGEGLGQVARAASDVQHLVAFAHAAGGDGIGLPQAVQAHRHQVVHDVVLAGHGVEDAAHARGLLGFVDGLETEVGVAHVYILARGSG
jgi:hypothetical protein